jgi:imidazolonepropionase-like amidohydrolase
MPRKGSLTLVFAALALACASGCGSAAPATGRTPQTPPSPAPDVTLALVGGTLIDGTGAAPVSNAVVLIAGDRIAAAGPAGTVAVPSGVRTIDVSGGTILPGFINAHVHFAFDAAHLRAWAQGGVTTVRDESASTSQIAGLKALRAEMGKDPANARLVSAGTMLAVPGGYGQLFVSSPDEARRAVQREIDDGVDAVKVALEDGYAGTSGLPKPTPEELAAIVEVAHAHGLPVSGHITQGAYLAPLLAAGVDDVAHIPYDAMPGDGLAEVVSKGVYLVPTFTVFRNYGAPLNVGGLSQFVAMGGKVALGNDYGGGPGDFELGMPMFEIQTMSQAGMTPMQVILAGTANAAHVLRLDREIGTLEAGKAADVLVVGGDPLADLAALADARLVIHDGVVIRDRIDR